MNEPSNKLTAFESVFEAWLSKAAPPSVEIDDDVGTESESSPVDKINNSGVDMETDIPSRHCVGPSSASSQSKDVQDDKLVTKQLLQIKSQSVIVSQAIKRKYFSCSSKLLNHSYFHQTASNNSKSLLNKSVAIKGRLVRATERHGPLTKRKVSRKHTNAKFPTSFSSHSLVKYVSDNLDDKTQVKKSSFTDGHEMLVTKSTEVSPVSDAGYVDDVAVDSEHDDMSRRSNGYHSMEEFQLTSVSPTSQSESPLSSAGEGNHLPFLCSKGSGAGFNMQSVYIDRRMKSARKNLSPNSYDADSDFVESPHSCYMPPSKSPSYTVSHRIIPTSPEHTAEPSVTKHYKLDCQRDSERPLILKIKCDRSPQHKKSPIYFCENVTPTESPPKLKIGSRRKSSLMSEMDSFRRKAKRQSGIVHSRKEVEYTHGSAVESGSERLSESGTVNKEQTFSPDHSFHDSMLQQRAQVTKHSSPPKSRRNSSRVCGCCMSSPKRHRLKGEKRKRSISTSNALGSQIYTSGSTSNLKCDVTLMTPQQKKFVKSALNLSSLQQKLHTLFLHLFPRMELALMQMPPESLRFEEMLDEVIRTLERSPEQEDQIDSEELSKQLSAVSLNSDFSLVTIFKPEVQLCNDPKDCLEEYQQKIYTLLKLLLPDLTIKYEYVLRFPKDLEKFLDQVIAWNYRPL